MPDAHDCAILLLETIPGLMRGIGGTMRQQKNSDEEPLTIGQLRLMQMLHRRHRTLSELATVHHVTPSTMSRSVDVLVRRDWVARQHDPHDRRQLILRLTDDGRNAYATMTRHTQEHVTRLIERLSDDERARLYDGLSVLRSLVDQLTPDDGSCTHSDKMPE